MMLRRTIGFAVIGFAALLGLLWVMADRSSTDEVGAVSSTIQAVELNGHRVQVELALTDDEQANGLSGRAALGSDEGMLFPYASPRPLAFWMKDMNFPIDIIWIRNRRVIDLTENAPVPKPGQSLPLYRPKEEADAVLEVRAGFAEANGVAVGTDVRYLCFADIDDRLAPC